MWYVEAEAALICNLVQPIMGFKSTSNCEFVLVRTFSTQKRTASIGQENRGSRQLANTNRRAGWGNAQQALLRTALWTPGHLFGTRNGKHDMRSYQVEKDMLCLVTALVTFAFQIEYRSLFGWFQVGGKDAPVNWYNFPKALPGALQVGWAWGFTGAYGLKCSIHFHTWFNLTLSMFSSSLFSSFFIFHFSYDVYSHP